MILNNLIFSSIGSSMGWATGWTIGWAMGCGLLFGWVGLFNLLGLGLCYWCWLAVRLGWVVQFVGLGVGAGGGL